jgi:hypothetical protein
MCEQQLVHLTAAHSADVARAPREPWLVDAVAREIIAFVSAPTRASACGRGCAECVEVGAIFTKLRWDFGDGTPFHDTDEPTAEHHYKMAGDYAVRIEATDDLGHSAISKNTVHITG